MTTKPDERAAALEILTLAQDCTISGFYAVVGADMVCRAYVADRGDAEKIVAALTEAPAQPAKPEGDTRDLPSAKETLGWIERKIDASWDIMSIKHPFEAKYAFKIKQVLKYAAEHENLNDILAGRKPRERDLLKTDGG